MWIQLWKQDREAISYVMYRTYHSFGTLAFILVPQCSLSGFILQGKYPDSQQYPKYHGTNCRWG